MGINKSIIYPEEIKAMLNKLNIKNYTINRKNLYLDFLIAKDSKYGATSSVAMYSLPEIENGDFLNPVTIESWATNLFDSS